jgi:YD repeat-containing protein
VSTDEIDDYGTALFGANWESVSGISRAQMQDLLGSGEWKPWAQGNSNAFVAELRSVATASGYAATDEWLRSTLKDAGLMPIDAANLGWFTPAQIDNAPSVPVEFNSLQSFALNAAQDTDGPVATPMTSSDVLVLNSIDTSGTNLLSVNYTYHNDVSTHPAFRIALVATLEDSSEQVLMYEDIAANSLPDNTTQTMEFEGNFSAPDFAGSYEGLNNSYSLRVVLDYSNALGDPSISNNSGSVLNLAFATSNNYVVVQGSADNDTITSSYDPATGLLSVTPAATTYEFSTTTGESGTQLYISTKNGDDTIALPANMPLSTHVFGGRDKDTISGGSGVVVIDGGEGDDSITGSAGTFEIDGGEGNDTITGGTGQGANQIDATQDVDQVYLGDNYGSASVLGVTGSYDSDGVTYYATLHLAYSAAAVINMVGNSIAGGSSTVSYQAPERFAITALASNSIVRVAPKAGGVLPSEIKLTSASSIAELQLDWRTDDGDEQFVVATASVDGVPTRAVQVDSTRVSFGNIPSLAIRGSHGDSRVQVAKTADSLALPAQIGFDGGPGNNRLFVNMLEVSASHTFNFVDNQLQLRVGATDDLNNPLADPLESTITCSLVDRIDVIGGTAKDVFLYHQTPSSSVSLIKLIGGEGDAGDIVRAYGTLGDDVIELDKDSLRLNGGPMITMGVISHLALDSSDGDDRIYVRNIVEVGEVPSGMPYTPLMAIITGDGVDVIDLSGNDFSTAPAGRALRGFVDYNDVSLQIDAGAQLDAEQLILSNTHLSSLPSIAGFTYDAIHKLDLRNNELELFDEHSLDLLAGRKGLDEVLLSGNVVYGPEGQTPDLKPLKGLLLRVDLPDYGLELAEQAATQEAALAGIARALHYSPLAAYDYVANNYEFEYYYGFRKGDLGTIRTRSGNAFDQSQLLVDLLTIVAPNSNPRMAASLLNSDFVGKNVQNYTVGGLVFPIDELKSWLGIQDTATLLATLDGAWGPNDSSSSETNNQYHQIATIPSDKPVAEATGVAMSHVWVTANLDLNTATDDQVLDPSWKFHQSTTSLSTTFGGLLTALGAQSIGTAFIKDSGNGDNSFDTSQLAAGTDSYNPFVSNPYFHLDPNGAGQQLAYEWFEDQVSQWLAKSRPAYGINGGVTLADVSPDRVIIPRFTDKTVLSSLTHPASEGIQALRGFKDHPNDPAYPNEQDYFLPIDAASYSTYRDNYAEDNRKIVARYLSEVEIQNLQQYVRVRLFRMNGQGDYEANGANFVPLPQNSQLPLSVRWEVKRDNGALKDYMQLYVGDQPWEDPDDDDNYKVDYVGKITVSYTGFDLAEGDGNSHDNRINPYNDSSTEGFESQQFTNIQKNTSTVIAVEAHQISNATVNSLQSSVNADALAVLKTRNGQLYDLTGFKQEQVAHVLSTAVFSYLQDMSVIGRPIADMFNVKEDSSRISTVVAFAKSRPDFVTTDPEILADMEAAFPMLPFKVYPDLALPVIPEGLTIDQRYAQQPMISRVGNERDLSEFHGLWEASASSAENLVWERLTNTPTFSTVRAIQEENQQSTPKFFLFNEHDWTNPSTELAAAFASGGAYENLEPTLRPEIDELVVGRVIVLPAHPSTIQSYEFPALFATDDPTVTSSVESNLWWIAGQNGGIRADVAPSASVARTADSAPNSISITNGAVVQSMTDITIPGLYLPLTFSRTYDSSQSQDGILGRGWFYTFGDRLDLNASPGNVTWIDEHGQSVVFVPPDGGIGIYTQKDANRVTGVQFTKESDGTYYLRFTDGRRFKFDPDAYLDRVEELHGAALHIERDLTNAITSVWSDAGGKTEASTAVKITFGYDANGHLASLTTKDGRTWTYVVSPPPPTGGDYLLTEVQSATYKLPDDTSWHAIVAYSYLQDQEYSNTRLENLLESVTTSARPAIGSDEDIRTSSYEYYPNGRAFRLTNPDQTVQSFEYAPVLGRSYFIDERGQRTIYDFNNQGRTTRVIHPDRTFEKYEYWAAGEVNTYLSSPAYDPDDDNLLKRQVDAYGIATIYASYNQFGQVEKVIQDYALSGIDLEIQDSFGLITNPTTLYGFDTVLDSGVLVYSKVNDVVLPSGSTMGDPRHTHTTYNAQGDITRVEQTLCDPMTMDGVTLTTIYHYEDGLLKWVQNPRRIEDIEPIADGNPGDTEYQEFLDTAYSVAFSNYNDFGIPETVTYWIDDPSLTANGVPDGNPNVAVETSHYDSRGYLSTFTDRYGKTTTYLYDSLHRLKEMHQPEVNGPVVTKYWHDELGGLVKTEDAEGRITVNLFDSRHRVVQTTVQESTAGLPSSVVQTEYDPTGNVIATTDGAGNVVAFRYDARNRLTMTINPDQTYSYVTYNGAGQVTSQTDERGHTTVYSYDNFGREVVLQEPGRDDSTPGREWHFEYDAVGNRTKETLIVANGNRETDYLYDTLNRLIQRTDPDPGFDQAQPQTNYTYDNIGNLKGMSVVDAANPTQLIQYVTYTYDGLNRVTSEKSWVDVGATNSPNDDKWITVSYAYADTENTTTVTDGRNIETRYKYDELGRLKDVLVDSAGTTAASENPYDSPHTTYAYDQVGNLIEESTAQRDQELTGGNVWKQTYSYDSLNRLISATTYDVDGTTPLATESTRYDAAGNAVWMIDPRGFSTHYEYDSRNRTTRTEDAIGHVVTTAYDPTGNVQEVVEKSGPSLIRTEQFEYDNLNRVIEDRTPFSGGPDPVVTYDYDSETGDLHAVTSGEDPETKRTTSYEYDALGRLVTVTEPQVAGSVDGVDGTIQPVTEYRYDVLGNVVEETMPSGLIVASGYDGLSRLTQQVNYA